MPDAPGHVGVVADGRDEKEADEVHVPHAFQPRFDVHLLAPDSQGLPPGGPRTRLVNLTGKRQILSKALWLILSFPLQFTPTAISTRGFDLDCHATCLLDKQGV